MPTYARFVAAFVSGAVLSLVSPPVGLHWLHWVSFVPILLALHPTDHRLNFRLGYFSGFVAVFLLFFWLAETIVEFSNLPMIAAAGVLALFAAVWGLPYGLLMLLVHPLRRRFGPRWVFLFPACWVASEYLQPALFPYFQGVGQYRALWVWQLASVFGAMGVTWLLLLVNCAVAELVDARGAKRAWLPFGIAAGLFFANLGFGAWRTRHVDEVLASAPIKRVSILQQHVTMTERLKDSGRKAFRSWVALTAKLEGEDVDLIVWPEGAVPGNPHEGDAAEFLGELAARHDAWFLTGGGTAEADRFDANRRIHRNSCYLFDPDGEVVGRYDKMVPLPFGEYLPWPVSYLRDYIQGPGNFRAGETPYVFDAGGLRFTTPICYEAILEAQMRNLMDTDVFVNITNDGWFGDTAAPHQHAMLSAVQAVQFGRPMLRVAYTGISMVVDPNGRIHAETEPYTDVAEVVPMRVATFDTPYRTWGGWFPLLAAGVGATAALMAFRNERRLAAEAAPSEPVTPSGPAA
ncbi:MAG: apolipoprotein N-acyltransferase [Myxococcota bacterium]